MFKLLQKIMSPERNKAVANYMEADNVKRMKARKNNSKNHTPTVANLNVNNSYVRNTNFMR